MTSTAEPDLAVLGAPGSATTVYGTVVLTTADLLARQERAAAAGPGATGGTVVDTLLGVLASASFALMVDVSYVGQVLSYRYCGDQARLVQVGPVGPDHVELTPLEPVGLPWAVLALVRLGPRPRGALTGPVEVAVAALERAGRLLQSGGDGAADGARSLLCAGGLDPAAAAQVAALLEGQVATWRAASGWRDPGGEQRRRTGAFLDGGPAGIVRASVVDDDGGTLRLEPATAPEAWQEILGLLPGRGDAARPGLSGLDGQPPVDMEHPAPLPSSS